MRASKLGFAGVWSGRYRRMMIGILRWLRGGRHSKAEQASPAQT